MKRKYASSALQLVSGLLMVLAGIVSFFMPHVITKAMILIIAFATLVSGILSLIFYFRNRNQPFLPTSYLANGILNIVLGVLLFFTDSVRLSVVFVYLLAGWFVVQSIFLFASAFGLKRAGFTQWWMPLVVSVLGILLALLMFFNPVTTLVVVSVIIGIYLLIHGVVKIAEFFAYR